MPRTIRVRTAWAAVFSALAAAASAQTPSAPARTAEPPAVEPAAMDALRRMGGYLRTLKVFQVDATTSDEKVLDDGQKLLTDGSAKVLARTPSALYAEVENDRHDRIYVYDGKTFTLYGKRLNFYATVPAPPTIRELIDRLDEKYGFSVPFEDLFRWGAPGSGEAKITGAMEVGPSVVLGTTCKHYAFRQADIDWQLWIQEGEFPLPRKLAITTRTDDARPQHVAVYTWNLAPSFNDATFEFKPPEGAGRVVLDEGKAPAGAAKPGDPK
jgi:hypothetical protein